MYIACVPSKRKGSIIEKNPQLPGSHRARRIVGGFRIPGHRNRIDCKRRFWPACECFSVGREVDEVCRLLATRMVSFIGYRMLDKNSEL